MKPLHPIQVFRLMVLGPLISRDQFSRGELKKLIEDLASHAYKIPCSKRTHLSPQTIERWYYAWLRNGIDALAPKTREDKNKSLALSAVIQERLLHYKNEKPSRSINTLITLLEKQGLVAKNELSRATIHRFLKIHGLSKRTLASIDLIERRSFVAEHVGDIWYGDVLHGPSITTVEGMKKTYLVSLMDDASRLITHSAFCLGETALNIEDVLKQAILKRGLPKKLVIDNGAAYRAASLQGICARLSIRLIYCRPYEPQGKGKLERYHRTFREQFLDEINFKAVRSLEDLNARLWAWLDEHYHQKEHSGLPNHLTPIARWRQDLVHIRSLGTLAANIDEIFYHRIKRLVYKDGTVSWNGKRYEVLYETVGQTVYLVINPQEQTAHRIETEKGESLGPVTLLNQLTNLGRKRQRPEKEVISQLEPSINAVDLVYEQHQKRYQLNTLNQEP